jgi:hypothetical protein
MSLKGLMLFLFIIALKSIPKKTVKIHVFLANFIYFNFKEKENSNIKFLDTNLDDF